MNRDPICALCTPPGRAALALIRLSGPGAVRIVRSLASFLPEKPAPRKAYLGEIKAEGRAVDQAVLTCFPAGKSFTGEETVEISCHGSPVLYHEILKRLVLAGARPARRGEFSLRAFMNGKIDLPQAEGLQKLIESRNPRSARTAFYQLKGRFSRELKELETKWLDLLSRLEADIDFPLEGLPSFDPAQAALSLKELRGRVQNILSRYRPFENLQRGLSAGLFGPVNVGKSTLFNRLTGEDKSIVTREAGATRDIVEGFLPDSPLVLKDTAGFRGLAEHSPLSPPGEKRVGGLGKAASPAVEKRVGGEGETLPSAAPEKFLGEAERIGQQKARRFFRQADLRLLVLDGTEPFPPALQTLCKTFQRGLMVWTKKDLCPGVTKKELFSLAEKRFPDFFKKISLRESFFVSSVTGEGLGGLKAKLKSLSEEQESQEVSVSNLRHFKGLKIMDRALGGALSLLRGEGERDLMALELREGLSALHEITGKRLDDRVLDRIFKRFCIGK